MAVPANGPVMISRPRASSPTNWPNREGFNEPSPEIKWAERSAILPNERWAFHASAQQSENNLRQVKQSQLLEGVPLGARDTASVRREAISRALVEHGFLMFRRKQFILPFNRRNA